MRIAGFTLGTRFTIDDFDTASDIIKGDIRISLGSLEESEEAKENRAAILDMVEELRNCGSDGIAEGVVESEILGENSEVKASQHNSSENDIVTVAEFSTMGTHLPQGLSNSDVVFDNNITEENEDSLYTEDNELEDEEDDYFGDDTSDEEVDTSEDNFEVYEDDDEEDDYDFGGFDETSVEDEEPEEDYIDPIDAEIQRILGQNKPQEVTKPTPEVVKPTPEVKKPTTEVRKPAPEVKPKPQPVAVNKPQEVVRKPIHNSGTAQRPVNTAGGNARPNVPQQKPNVATKPVNNGTQGNGSVTPQPIRKQPINNTGAKPIIKKPIANNGTPQQVVKKPVSTESNRKPDYTSMPIKEVYIKYVKAFMMKNGVQRGIVDGKLLSNEFGAEIVLKLSKGGYILKRGSGYTMGL